MVAAARFIANLLLVAACCALLIAVNRADAHSLTPARASAISRASIARTAAVAQDSISSFVIGPNFSAGEPLNATQRNGTGL